LQMIQAPNQESNPKHKQKKWSEQKKQSKPAKSPLISVPWEAAPPQKRAMEPSLSQNLINDAL